VPGHFWRIYEFSFGVTVNLADLRKPKFEFFWQPVRIERNATVRCIEKQITGFIKLNVPGVLNEYGVRRLAERELNGDNRTRHGDSIDDSRRSAKGL
jgi:hypothetical protein